MPRTLIIRHPETRQQATGFTLIEILVTISIIALLIAISFPVMTAFLQNATASQTKALLKQLESSVSEYEAQTGQKPYPQETSGATNYLFDYPDGDGVAGSAARSDESIVGFGIITLQNTEPALEMFNTVNEQFKRPVSRGTGADQYPLNNYPRQAGASNDQEITNVEAVNDAWDRPIRFFPGTLSLEANEPVARLNRTEIEDKGMPRRKNPYFASAGQDGIWGRIDPDTDERDEDAADNHYSFEAD